MTGTGAINKKRMKLAKEKKNHYGKRGTNVKEHNRTVG
jgi:hypothetical protein